MPVSRATVLNRIRLLIVEALPDFWTDAELIQWFDEGAARQHRVVLENLKLRREASRDPEEALRLFSIAQKNDYVRAFLKTQAIVTAGVGHEYALAADFFALVGVQHTPAGASRPSVLEEDAHELDFLANELPHYRPSTFVPRYSINYKGKISLRAGTATTIPAAGLTFEVLYLRDFVKTGATGDVDLLDPFNNGPVRYAVGMARGKQNVDPSPWLMAADAEASTIMPAPPARPS